MENCGELPARNFHDKLLSFCILPVFCSLSDIIQYTTYVLYIERVDDCIRNTILNTISMNKRLSRFVVFMLKPLQRSASLVSFYGGRFPDTLT